MAQTLVPDGGTITEDGVCVLGNRAFLRQHVGYVPQTDALIPELTVAEQLALWQRLTGRPAHADRALWELLDLDGMRKKARLPSTQTPSSVIVPPSGTRV